MTNILYHYDDRNVGFGSNIFVAFSVIKYCIKNNLRCNINIKNNLYASKEKNVWDLFLDQPFKIYDTAQDLKDTVNPFKLNCWEFENPDVTRQKFDDVNFIDIYRELFKNNFLLKKEIIETSNLFLEKYKNKKILGIHKRGTDMFYNGHGFGQKHLLNNEYIFNIIDSKLEEYDYIFLMSDEHSSYTNFISRYNKKLIYFDDKREFGDQILGLHNSSINLDEETKIENLKKLLIEVKILSLCNYLLLMHSNLSHIALLLSSHIDCLFYDRHIKYHS